MICQDAEETKVSSEELDVARSKVSISTAFDK